MADAISIRITEPARRLIVGQLGAMKVLPQTEDMLAKSIERHRLAGRISNEAVQDITGIIADLKFQSGYQPDEVAALQALDFVADAMHALEQADFKQAEEREVLIDRDLAQRVRKELVDLFESGVLTGQAAVPMRAALRSLKAGEDSYIAAGIKHATGRLPAEPVSAGNGDH